MPSDAAVATLDPDGAAMLFGLDMVSQYLRGSRHGNNAELVQNKIEIQRLAANAEIRRWSWTGEKCDEADPNGGGKVSRHTRPLRQRESLEAYLEVWRVASYRQAL